RGLGRQRHVREARSPAVTGAEDHDVEPVDEHPLHLRATVDVRHEIEPGLLLADVARLSIQRVHLILKLVGGWRPRGWRRRRTVALRSAALRSAARASQPWLALLFFQLLELLPVPAEAALRDA